MSCEQKLDVDVICACSLTFLIHSTPSLPLSVPHQFTRLTTARTVTGSPFVSELSRSHHQQSPQYYQNSPQYYYHDSSMAPAWHRQPQPPHASAATKSHTSSSTSQYSSSMRNERTSSSTHRREYIGESSERAGIWRLPRKSIC